MLSHDTPPPHLCGLYTVYGLQYDIVSMSFRVQVGGFRRVAAGVLPEGERCVARAVRPRFRAQRGRGACPCNVPAEEQKLGMSPGPTFDPTQTDVCDSDTCRLR